MSSPQKVYLGLFKILGVFLRVCLGLIGVQIVKIISLTSIARVFENLEKKIQIKSFWRFWVFIMSYRANSKKKEMTENDLHVSANLLGNNERHMEK